jgi:hypothetical protein
MNSPNESNNIFLQIIANNVVHCGLSFQAEQNSSTKNIW